MQTTDSIFPFMNDQIPAKFRRGDIDSRLNISPKHNHKHPHPHREPLAGWLSFTSKDQGRAR